MGEGTETLRFDEENHAYHLGEERLISVTQAIKQAGLMPNYGPSRLPMVRGSFVAEATQYFDEGTLDESSLDSELVPYLDSWKRFLDQADIKILGVEETIHNEFYRYAGRLDRRAILNGMECVLDIKTGPASDWHPLQTSAYSMCYKRPIKRYAVYLRPGYFRLAPHENDNEDWGVFVAALTIARWKMIHG